MIERLAVFGVGLIGGSFALALKARGGVRAVVGFDRDPAVLQRAQRLGVIDTIGGVPGPILSDCDLALLAAPVAQTRTILKEILPWLDSRTIVTDAGSTKSDVIGAAREIFGPAVGQFVPGHPLAGGEKQGPEAADADLFAHRKVVLTPLAENHPHALDMVRTAWEHCGAVVEMLDAAVHDAALAAVSHLPHLLAYALVAQVVDSDDGALKMSLAGGGFRDFTRIAASSPEMWRDIALANRDRLLRELQAYQGRLAQLCSDLQNADGNALESLFRRASRARLEWEQGS